MYRFTSGDRNNDAIIKFAQMNQDGVRKLLDKHGKLYEVEDLVFLKDDMDKMMLNNTILLLTVSDQFKIPIDERSAQIMFFALMNNFYNKELRIKNRIQAMSLYFMYEGDYGKIEPEEDDRNPDFFPVERDFPRLVKGFDLKFYIPITSFRKENKRIFTLSGVRFCHMCVNGERYQIPRQLYVPFFAHRMINNRLFGDEPTKMLEGFDVENVEALVECLKYVGFVLRRGFDEIIVDKSVEINDGHVVQWSTPVDEDHKHLWSHQGNNWVLLPMVKYVPMYRKSMETIAVFMQ